MFVTSFIGVTFSNPSKLVVKEEEKSGSKNETDEETKKRNKKKLGIIFGSGPVVSGTLAIGFFLVLTLGGGNVADVAKLGISINLLMATYSMMPAEPMDGSKVANWKPWLGVIFIPLFIVYIMAAIYL